MDSSRYLINKFRFRKNVHLNIAYKKNYLQGLEPLLSNKGSIVFESLRINLMVLVLGK